MTEYDPSPVEVEDANPVKKLTLEECWNLLESHEFGRLAYHLAGEVHIVPINYATDGKRIYFRTAEGSKLLGIVMNEDVAFEIDQVLGDFASSVGPMVPFRLQALSSMIGCGRTPRWWWSSSAAWARSRAPPSAR